jgi:host factor-I protein
MDRDGGSVNIQDSYLGRACRERAWITVHLNGGKRMTGRIRSFDRYTLILEDRGSEQMIFKHAIATISMARSFSNAIQFGESAKGKKPQSKAAAAPREGALPGGQGEQAGQGAGKQGGTQTGEQVDKQTGEPKKPEPGSKPTESG